MRVTRPPARRAGDVCGFGGARADGVKNRFPLHFMAKAEWNGRTDADGLRAVRVAADGSSMRWARAGRLAGGQGAEEEGKNVLSVFNK